MNPTPILVPTSTLSRRHFLKRGSALVAGSSLLGSMAAERFAFGASGNDTLKIALIGCGGRGSGAANQALSTYNIGPVKLVAMADVHEDRLTGSLANLQKNHADRIDVPKERQFIGFDKFKEAISLCDVAILATPPGFRPAHFEEAIRQGKHVFMEKPVASDAAGVRQVLAAAEEAKKKNLKVGVGLQRHHQLSYQETMKRIHGGDIGEIVSARCYWNGNRPWQKKRADLEKQYGPMTEMQYQLRNWYYFTWLSGDHIAEQHIHNIDVINWAKNAHPVKARSMGGREITNGPDDGEIYDHFACEFEYEDGSVCFSFCRHQPGCWNSVSEYVQGTKGRSEINGGKIFGDNQWRFKAEGAKDPYQQEHDDLFTAIRKDQPFNEAFYGAESTMTAILGRMAAYSGKELEWTAALNSKIALVPTKLAWDAEAPVKPGSDGFYQKAVPGKTAVL